jgi:hypothetical protein
MNGRSAPMSTGTMIPAGIRHDRVAAVLMRDDRAARLPPIANIAVAELLEAGGERPLSTLAVAHRSTRCATLYRWNIQVRCELERAAPVLARIGIAIEVDADRMVRLVDTTQSIRSAA